MKVTSLHTLALIGTVFAFGPSDLYAQQRETHSSDRYQEEAQDQSDNNREQGRSDRQRSETQFRLSPAGWVRIATDYDNDGRFDAIETIFAYDLERAQASSRERAKREAQEFTNRSQPKAPREAVSGKLERMEQHRLAGIDGQVTVARIETDDGRTARVCLGPETQLERLDLREGDQVSIKGRRGHINDKMVLIAQEIRAGDQRVSIHLPSGRRLNRLKGEVLSTRTANFQGFDEAFLVAEVELPTNQQELVNLGPKSRLQTLKVQKGDVLSLLVRPGFINGEPAMIAEQIEHDGEVVRLRRAEETRIFGTPAQDQGADEQRDTPDSGDRNSGDRSAEDRSVDTDSERITYDGRERAALGVTLSDTPQRGVQIQRVLRDSPADRSDLQPGDQILALNGEKVESYRDVVSALRDHQPNDQLDIRVRRGDRTLTTSVELAERAEVFDLR